MKKRKMNVLYVVMAFCGLLSVMDSSAQKPCTDDVVQNSLWTAPELFLNFNEDGQIGDFSLPIPPDAVPGDDYTGQTATNAHNAMHDQNGDLMFFIVDDGLYDKNGYGMAKLNLTSGAIPGVKGYSEICIVPDPANCEQYYIFSSTHGNEARTPVYTVLDLSLPNANDPENDDKSGALLYGDFA